MQSRDTSSKAICNIEHCAIRLRQMLRNSQKVRVNNTVYLASFATVKNFHCSVSPNRPLTQQTAYKMLFLPAMGKGGQQIHNDVIVIASIQRHLVSAMGLHNALHQILSAVSIKTSALDCNHIRNIRNCAEIQKFTFLLPKTYHMNWQVYDLLLVYFIINRMNRPPWTVLLWNICIFEVSQ